MSPSAQLLLLMCVLAQACQPAADRQGTRPQGPSSAPPTGPVRVSEWVSGLSEPGARTGPPALRAAVEPQVPPAVANTELVPAGAAELAQSDEARSEAPDEPTREEPVEADPGLDPSALAGPGTDTGAALEPLPDTPPEVFLARVAAGAPAPPAELLRAVLRAPSSETLEEARRLNKDGLAKHRKGDLQGALADYEAALRVAPAHVFSRYNLACALTLLDRTPEALMHLAVLAHQASEERPARDRLKAARIDKDFDTLRGDPRFRELTLATALQVTWPADGLDPAADRDAAQKAHKRLRDARWDSQLARAPWRGDHAGPALLVRGADLLDLRAAREILDDLEAVHPGRYSLELDAALPSSGPPLVLIVSAVVGNQTSAEELAPEPAQPAEGADAPGEQLESLLGKRLSASVGGVIEHLELRATGFFSWERRDGASRVLRQGRWELTADGLALSYSARITEGDPPTLVVHDGQSSTHSLSISGRTLWLDGRAFR